MGGPRFHIRNLVGSVRMWLTFSSRRACGLNQILTAPAACLALKAVSAGPANRPAHQMSACVERKLSYAARKIWRQYTRSGGTWSCKSNPPKPRIDTALMTGIADTLGATAEMRLMAAIDIGVSLAGAELTLRSLDTPFTKQGCCQLAAHGANTCICWPNCRLHPNSPESNPRQNVPSDDNSPQMTHQPSQKCTKETP